MDGIYRLQIDMNRFFANDIENNTAYLGNDESFHLSAVLRLEKGERVEIVNGGKLYVGTVEKNDKKNAVIDNLQEIPVESEPKVKVTLFQGVPKGSKMEFAVQKCTEIGVSSIVPVITKRCVVKAKDGKEERLNRVAFEACKQCKRVFVPRVESTVELEDVDFSSFDLLVVPYEDEHAVSIKQVLSGCDSPAKVGVVIGPEGGFEAQEIDMLKQKGAKCVSLGRRILRSETAGMATLCTILYHYGDMEI